MHGGPERDLPALSPAEPGAGGGGGEEEEDGGGQETPQGVKQDR